MHQRHMPETDALGLDYCISSPEVQLIQSQPMHNEHMHSGTTSEDRRERIMTFSGIGDGKNLTDR